jgi:hypothetical protein
MSYATLKASIRSWINAPEIEQELTTFITNTEAKMNRALSEANIPGKTTRATATMDEEYETLPPYLSRLISLTIDGDKVQNVTPESLESMRTLNGTSTGQPEWCAVVGGELRLYPVPDEAYDAEMVYEINIPALSDSNTTNWLLDAYPDAYLYGSLTQAGIFLSDNRLN